jgi:4'-phosphopantetheinyl transferase EntD
MCSRQGLDPKAPGVSNPPITDRARSSAGPRDVGLEGSISGVIMRLAGKGVFAATCEIGGDEGLLGPELTLVAGAGARRRAEFAAGRRCARRALSALGAAPTAISRGPVGQPIWPPGFCGAISHDGRLASALAYGTEGGSPLHGLDLVDLAGDRRADFEEIEAAVKTRAEADRWSGDWREVARLFSIKEAAIKILSPLEGRLIAFQDIEVWPMGVVCGVRCANSRAFILARCVLVGDFVVSVSRLAEDHGS